MLRSEEAQAVKDQHVNKQKLKQAEQDFMRQYPGGFLHPELVAVGKKHKMEKLVDFAQANFAKNQFDDVNEMIERMAKMISRSSMTSVFEKPKYRDYLRGLSYENKKKMVKGLKDLLHSRSLRVQEEGFNAQLDVLYSGKLAKWTMLTCIPAYYYPNTEVFVKPTTCKGVIQFFELESLHYKPAPTWAFYQQYKQAVLGMKADVDELLAPNNAAFSGFLRMAFKSG